MIDETLNEIHEGKYNNLCMIMDKTEVVDFLRNAYMDKINETNIGHYDSFLNSEEALMERVKSMRGTQEFHKAKYYVRKLYEY